MSLPLARSVSDLRESHAEPRSTVVFAAANCLIETTCLLPVEGGFITLAERFVSRPFGMALGWNVSRLPG